MLSYYPGQLHGTQQCCVMLRLAVPCITLQLHQCVLGVLR